MKPNQKTLNANAMMKPCLAFFVIFLSAFALSNETPKEAMQQEARGVVFVNEENPWRG